MAITDQLSSRYPLGNTCRENIWKPPEGKTFHHVEMPLAKADSTKGILYGQLMVLRPFRGNQKRILSIFLFNGGMSRVIK